MGSEFDLELDIFHQTYSRSKERLRFTASWSVALLIQLWASHLESYIRPDVDSPCADVDILPCRFGFAQRGGLPTYDCCKENSQNSDLDLSLRFELLCTNRARVKARVW